MDLLKLLMLCLVPLTLGGCQVGYLAENGYYQADLLLNRTSLENSLQDSTIPEKEKTKLKLAKEAKIFAEDQLSLKRSNNYNSFVQLSDDYVVYSLTVAPKDRLEPYEWWFPFFGKFPYLGFFNKRSAKMAQEKYQSGDYDTHLRGVTAFSSLGWFDDPILSSMLSYSDYDLVNTIIHETVHATLYIKNAVDFNERLATFVGNLGTEKFYLTKEGANSPTLEKARKENVDDQIFSTFISSELESLRKWYKEQKKPIDEDLRKSRIQEIQTRFTTQTLPKMKSESYRWFGKAKLNNARLLSYQTYYKDLSDFELAYKKVGYDLSKFIIFCKSLEGADNPEKELKEFVQQVSEI